MKNKFIFLKESEVILEKIYDYLNEQKPQNINTIDPKKTVLVIVDMINGFAKDGALYSPRVKGLIPEIMKLSYKCEELKIKKIAFADCHDEKSPEFASYPKHCVVNTTECEIVDELKTIGGFKLINKNSTNGFLEPEFQEWLSDNEEIKNFIVVGDCTDICVLQFVTTLKTHFNRQNKECRIIVPMNGVDTYDLDMHNGNLLHYIALYQMKMNDIEVVKEVII